MIGMIGKHFRQILGATYIDTQYLQLHNNKFRAEIHVPRVVTL